MSKKANPVAIGTFVIGVVVLSIAMSVLFGKSTLFSNMARVELLYKTSVKGLTIGAPVTVRGVKIGEVISITTKMYTDKLEYLTSVVIEIDRDAMVRIGSDEPDEKLFAELLKKGLGAQLKLQSLLTGLLYVDVDFYEPGIPKMIDAKTDYAQLPTVKTDFELATEELEKLNIDAFIKQLKNITSSLEETVTNPQFKQLGNTLNDTLMSVKNLANNIDQEVVGLRRDIGPVTHEAAQLLQQLNHDLPGITNKINDTLAKLNNGAKNFDGAIEKVDYLLSDDSPLIYQLEVSANELGKAAEALQAMADTIDRNPESLLRSKRGQ